MSEHQPERRIALFQQREVRRTIHNNEWWFVITDVVANALKGGGQFAPSFALEIGMTGGSQILQ